MPDVARSMLEAIWGRETAKVLARAYCREFLVRDIDLLDIMPEHLGPIEARIAALDAHDAQDAAMLKVVEAVAKVDKYRKVLAVAALSCPLMSIGEAADAVASLRVMADALAPLTKEDA